MRAPTIPAMTPQIATGKQRSQSPPQRTQRIPVSQMHAAIASSSVTPYIWIVNGPALYTPVGGEGIEASTAVTPPLCPPLRLDEDLERELGRTAAVEQLDRGAQVDVEPARQLGGRIRLEAGFEQLLGAPALDALELALDDLVYRRHPHPSSLLSSLRENAAAGSPHYGVSHSFLTQRGGELERPSF